MRRMERFAFYEAGDDEDEQEDDANDGGVSHLF